MKVYLSPAAHEHDNPTLLGHGENAECNAYCDILERRLKDHGIETKRSVKGRTGSAGTTATVKESNAFAPMVHYVCHTNAGGGNRSVTFYWDNATSKKYAEILHKHRTSKYPGEHQIKTRSDLRELKETKAVCLYDELIFHDCKEAEEWFHNKNGMAIMAEETVKALCEIGGVPYKPVKKETVRLFSDEQIKAATDAVKVAVQEALERFTKEV